MFIKIKNFHEGSTQVQGQKHFPKIRKLAQNSRDHAAMVLALSLWTHVMCGSVGFTNLGQTFSLGLQKCLKMKMQHVDDSTRGARLLRTVCLKSHKGIW